MERRSGKKQIKENVNNKGTVKLPPIDSVSDGVKTVLDIDPHYFSLVQGTPIKVNSSINAYKKNVRDIALKRTVHGFLNEEMLRIDKAISTEATIFDNAAKLFEECKTSFDKFLAYDNDKTITVMKKSDGFNRDLMNKTEEHKKTNYEMASLKSKLQYIDETLLILLSFENFLHKVAPHLWQKNENIDLNRKCEEIFKMESDIFKNINISLIKDKLKTLLPPRLYFETPDQLLNIFNLLEKQNLNYLLITEEMNSLRNSFQKARDTYKVNLITELNLIQEKMTEIEDSIQWHTVRETELKEIFFEILEEKIRYLVSSEAALQIYTYVEYAYEQVIAINDTKQSTLDMAKALENEYHNIMLEMSSFDPKVVKEIEKEVFEQNAKDIRNAKRANQTLRNINKISKRLNVAYQPSERKIC